MLTRLRDFVLGYKSYLAAGCAGLAFLAGEAGWLSDGQVETALSGCGIAFGGAIAAKGQRILKALRS